MSIYTSEAGKQAIWQNYDRLVSEWSVPATTQTVSTRFGDTGLISWGDESAPPLVLLHGHATSAIMWYRFAPYLMRYRVYALDAIGQPGKSAQYIPKSDSREYVAWLVDTLDALKLDRVALLGISFGGFLALKLAANASERVKRVATLAPAGVTPIVLRTLVPALLPAFLTALSQRGMGATIRRMGKGDITPEAETMFRLHLKYFRGRPLIQVMSDDELRCLTMPVMLRGGTDDVFFNNANSIARLKQFAPHAKTALIQGESHLFNHYFTDHIQAISAFLEEGS